MHHADGISRQELVVWTFLHLRFYPHLSHEPSNTHQKSHHVRSTHALASSGHLHDTNLGPRSTNQPRNVITTTCHSCGWNIHDQPDGGTGLHVSSHCRVYETACADYTARFRLPTSAPCPLTSYLHGGLLEEGCIHISKIRLEKEEAASRKAIPVEEDSSDVESVEENDADHPGLRMQWRWTELNKNRAN